MRNKRLKLGEEEKARPMPVEVCVDTAFRTGNNQGVLAAFSGVIGDADDLLSGAGLAMALSFSAWRASTRR